MQPYIFLTHDANVPPLQVPCLETTLAQGLPGFSGIMEERAGAEEGHCSAPNGECGTPVTCALLPTQNSLRSFSCPTHHQGPKVETALAHSLLLKCTHKTCTKTARKFRPSPDINLTQTAPSHTNPHT